MAKFVMRKLSEEMNESKGHLYPRMKIIGKATLNDLARQICGATSFTAADVKGVVAALVQEMATQMAQGKSVHIEGLGRFRARLEVCAWADAEREDGSTGHRTAKSVRVGGVNFVADPMLTHETDRLAMLERYTPRKSTTQTIETLEARVNDAVSYLEQHHTMSVAVYAQRTGLNNSAATRELRALANDPDSPIGARGAGSHKIYVLKAELQA